MRQALAWWRSRVEAVERSTTLRYYGACLAAIHVLTFLYWSVGGFAVRILSERAPVCWPFFEDCAVAHGASRATMQAMLWFYGLAGAATVIAFLRRRVALALAMLAIVNLGKGAIFVLDYRFMGNYHYMPFIVTFLYLTWPEPRRVILYILVAFYISAGALKLDREWLSGAALIAPTWISGKLLEVACAYVVVMELVIVLGLLARDARVRWLVLGQLVVFHAYSWHVVGFFYPCVMGLLLAFFPLTWREGEPEGRTPWPAIAAIALYAAAQVAPHLYPGDSAITGEGRIFAINMMDARVECDQLQFVRAPNGVIEETSEHHTDVGLRIRCDPIRFWNIAQNACRERAALGDDVRIDVYLNARRTTDPTYHSVFAVEDFCDRAPTFDVWQHNGWLGARR